MIKTLKTNVLIFCLMLFTLSSLYAENQGQANYQGLEAGEFMQNWLILNPVPVFEPDQKNRDMEAQKNIFEKEQIPEFTFGKLKSGNSLKIQNNEYVWQSVHSTKNDINFIDVFGDTNYVISYAWAEITMPEEQEVIFGLGSDDGVKLWLNGELLFKNWIGRPVNEDDDIFKATLKKGKNELLVKVQNMEMGWGFILRRLGPEHFPQRLVINSMNGDIDEINLLLDFGADVNAIVDPGVTALHAAQIKGRTEVVNILEQKGADHSIPMPPKEKMIDFLFTRQIKENDPGAAVLVAQDGKIIYEKAFGMACLAHDVPITPDTKFRIGSITKQFTASAILKLVEEGKLSLDDKLSKFIPDFNRGDEVTITHLLTHTSGIQSYTDKADFLETVKKETAPQELINSFKNDDYNFNPGEQYRYNNSGYFLLGSIVEKLTDTSFGTYLKETFFEPLEMKNTGIHDCRTILKHEATGYNYSDGKVEKALDWDMSRAGGAGALYSTIGDLYKWNEAVFNGKVLGEESLKKAHTAAKLNDGRDVSPGGSSKYGFGWGIGQNRGIHEISHDGGLHGFVSSLKRYPDYNMTIVVLVNSAPSIISPGGTANEIAEIYLWEKMEKTESYSVDEAVDPAIYNDYVGKYEYPGGAILSVTKEGDQLYAQLSGQPRYEIFPKSENIFYWKVTEAQITFIRNDKNLVTHAVHKQGGAEFDAPRVKEEEAMTINPEIFIEYVGEYELAPNVKITVSQEDDQYFAQLTGQPKVELFPRSETEFFLLIVIADITFIKDDAGNVTSLILNQGGIKRTAQKVK